MSKLSNQEVADEIANKGLWSCITNRIGHRNIEDPKLARAWRRAEKILNTMENQISRLVKT